MRKNLSNKDRLKAIERGFGLLKGEKRLELLKKSRREEKVHEDKKLGKTSP